MTRWERLRAYLVRFFTSWVEKDPDPGYSALDREDGRGVACWNCGAGPDRMVWESDPTMGGMTDRLRCRDCDECQTDGTIAAWSQWEDARQS